MFVTAPDLMRPAEALRRVGPFPTMHQRKTRGEATTDEQGRYHILGLPPGEARVWAERSGWRYDYSAPFGVQAGSEARIPAFG